MGLLLRSAKNDEDDSGLDQSCARFDDDKLAVSGVTKVTGLCFLDDGVDWASMRLGSEFNKAQGKVQLFSEQIGKNSVSLQVSKWSIS